MTQQQLTEPQGVYSRSFGGLNLSQSSKSLPPSDSAVFHNCDISPDGAVVRRGGTSVIASIDVGATSPFLATDTIRTKGGSTYLVYITGTGLAVSLLSDSAVASRPEVVASVGKNIWTQTPTSVCTIATTAPYDRLLILTPQHPIVQLSIIERTVVVNCTSVNGSNQATLVGPVLTKTDSTLWNDTTPANYIATIGTQALPVVSKSSGFTFQLQGTAGQFTVAQNYTVNLRQITWQWWAESDYQEGVNMIQQVSRFNVTDADQNVRIPDALLTDFQPIYKSSQNIGMVAYSSSNFSASVYGAPIANPATENQYGFSNGGRYISAAGTSLQLAPFFCTFGAKQAAGGVGQVTFLRIRSIPFNGGNGAQSNNMRLFVDTTEHVWASTLFNPETFNTYNTTYTVTEQTFNVRTVATDVATFWAVVPPTASLTASAPIHLTNVGTASYFVGGQTLWYRNSPTNLDGTYVRAYGLGRYVDYSRRNFHSIGTLYRDRLVLVNPAAAQDQIVVSEVADETVPGEFYQFFQVTDALTGVVTDPFTVNVTSESREQITAILGWQNAIFVFTDTNTYSITAGEQFGESSYAVNLVSTYGAFNQNCVAVSNLTVLYMNRYGVFDLLNKPNTDQYGAVERSEKVRTLFNRDLVPDNLNGIHWLRYNEATNKLYCGLGVGSDTVTTSRVLMHNLTWQSWSTLSGYAPFRMYPPTQAFRYTLFFAELSQPRYVAIMSADMPFYLDFATFRVAAGYPFDISLPQPSFSVTADTRGVLQLPIPSSPGLTDFASASAIAKIGDSYVRRDGLPTTTAVNWRNAMVDYPATLALTGGQVSANGVVLVTTNTAEPFVSYAVVAPSASPAPLNQAVTSANGYIVKPASLAGVFLVGANYPSVYASPVFDLDSLGRLKRLRKLHLLFDTTITREQRYPFYDHCRLLNAAFVSAVFNYREQSSSATVELVGDSLRLDALEFDTPVEMRQQLQKSITLTGFGCDYQFYVTSVGSEAFKLSAYEFEVQPQRYKRYQGR